MTVLNPKSKSARMEKSSAERWDMFRPRDNRSCFDIRGNLKTIRSSRKIRVDVFIFQEHFTNMTY